MSKALGLGCSLQHTLNAVSASRHTGARQAAEGGDLSGLSGRILPNNKPYCEIPHGFAEQYCGAQ